MFGFDLICLCETWLNPTTPDVLLHIGGYTLFRSDRNGYDANHRPTKGGGLCIYVLDKYVDHITVLDEMSCINPDIEQLWLKLCIPNVKHKCIGCVYRPPKGNIARGLSNIRSTLDKIYEFNTDILMSGDFNINYNLRHSFKLLKDLEHDFDLFQIIENNTRTTKNSSTRIDLIFSNVNHITECGTIINTISDHEAVYLVKKKPRCKATYNYIEARSFQGYDVEDFQNDVISDDCWNTYNSCNDVNTKWEIFEDVIKRNADKHCPVKSIRVRSDSPTWFTKELVEEIYHRDRLYIQAKYSKKQEDWELFKAKKNQIKKLLNQAREEYVKEKLEQDKNDPKKFWRSINSLTGLGRNKSKKGLREISNDQGEILKGQDAANYMNTYYTNAGPDLASVFANTWNQTDCTIKSTNIFSFKYIPEETVIKLIKNIKITKSSAMGSLSSRLVKDAFQVCSYKLTDIFNHCLTTGVFPMSWGMGEITPIPKVNIHSKKTSDWRPITQIKLPGKLLERCVHTQLYNFFDEYHLHPEQHGFRPEKSTSTAVFDMLKKSFNDWNLNLYQTCIFIDFSKAFDCIDHNILISKLKLYGLDHSAIAFITSYFGNRYQQTTVDGYTSNINKVTYGTAQGSILGPLIFIIYVNDLFLEIMDKQNIIMYADDTLLMSSSIDMNESVSKCQLMLDKVITWCDNNKLTVNVKKTKCMFINPWNHTPNVIPMIKGKCLEVIKHFEYLGMQIDDKLQMNKHVENMYKKARCKLGILYKIRKFIGYQTSLLLYKVMILPHMEYGDFIVDSANQKSISKLDTLQVKAIRLTEYRTYGHRQEISKLMDFFGLEKLEIRRNRSLLRLMYNQSKVNSNVQEKNDYMTLRSSSKVKLKSVFTKLSKVQRSPYYRGLKLWNNLPENIQKEGSKTKFKNEIIKHVV